MKIDIKNLNIWKEFSVEDIAQTDRRVMYFPLDFREKLADVPEAVQAAESLYRAQTESGVLCMEKSLRKPVVWYVLFLTKKLAEMQITELDLEQRTMNCLRRAGIMTVGDLGRIAEGPEELRRIRGCGDSCIGDVTARLFACQYGALSARDRLRFLRASRMIGRPEEETGEVHSVPEKGSRAFTEEETDPRIMSFRLQAIPVLGEVTEDEEGKQFLSEMEKLSPLIGSESGLWPHIRFPVYTGTLSDDTDVEALSLHTRSYNCLKRAGLGSVRFLCAGIEGNEDALAIRNCGALSTGEIIGSIALYQYRSLDRKGQERYLEKIRDLNR